MSEIYLTRAGVVEGVKAMRKDKQVQYLSAMIRFETELNGTYYSEGKKVDEISVAFSADSGINPGDVVVMTLTVKAPFGQRFQPALEASTNGDTTISDEPEDPIDVLVDAVNAVDEHLDDVEISDQEVT